MASWNENTPADTDLISGGDDVIRQLKTDIRERMDNEHTWTATGANTEGTHAAGFLTNAMVNGSAAVAESKIALDGSSGHRHAGTTSGRKVLATDLDVTGITVLTVPRVNAGGTAFETSGKVVPVGEIVGTTDSQTLTSKTLTTPTIADLTNMTHAHAAASSGGTLALLDAAAGTAVASKALILGADKNVDTLSIAASGLKIGAGAGTAVTATAAELNKLAGTPAGLTATELGYVDGVTSAIQTQLNAKAAVYGVEYKNLFVKTVADNQSVSITADKILALDTNGLAILLSAVSVTVDLDVSAAINGRDAGSVAANQAWYLYVISNGSTTAGLASESPSAPTMPGGYTYKALVGWCTTDETTTPFNIEEFTQIDDVYTWKVQKKVAAAFGSNTTVAVNLAAGGALTYSVIPAGIVKSIRGKAHSIVSASYYFANPETFGTSLAVVNSEAEVSISATYGTEGTTFNLPIIENSTFYHQAHLGDEPACTWDVYVSGFTLKR